MPIIGIISKKKDIKELKNKLDTSYELIEITKESIQNLKNVKFEEIIFNKDINFTSKEYKYIVEIINKANYILVNADIEIEFFKNLKLDKPIKLITFGFNPKATISISSVREEYIIVSIQREIEKIENQEKKIETFDDKNTNIYNKLVKFIIQELHNV